jgi:hypothetical protein
MYTPEVEKLLTEHFGILPKENQSGQRIIETEIQNIIDFAESYTKKIPPMEIEKYW